MKTRSAIWKGLLAALCIVPPCILLALSFFKQWSFPAILPGEYSMEAWRSIFKPSNNISTAIGASVAIAVTVALLATLFGFVTSMVIAYHQYKKQLLMLTYLPFLLSPVIFAVCIKFYFIKMHLVGTIGGVMLAQLIIAYPYATIFFMSFWNNRALQFRKLAQTLGASPVYTFRKVLMPMALPMMIVAFFQCFLISWFEYGLTLVIGFGKVQTLTLKVFQYLTEANIFYAALSCSLLVLPPIILLWVNKKFIYNKMA